MTKFCLNQSGTASKRKNLQTERFWLLLTSPRLSTRSGTVLFFTNSSRSNSPLASFFGCAPSFLIVELKSRLVVPTAALSASDVGSPRAQYLVRSSSFCLLITSLRDLLRGAHASLYADDLAIWSSSPDPLKASSVVQSFFAVLETWSNLWRLPLNPKKCESYFFSTDSHQATFEPRLNLLGFPLLFNPTPKFLGVTFDRTLSFGAHVQFLCSKFYPRHKATASWGQLPLPLGVPQKNLSPYSTKPLSVRCLHMPLLDGSHFFVTLQPITWKFYTELHAGSLLVASFPPPPHDSFSRPNSL